MRRLLLLTALALPALAAGPPRHADATPRARQCPAVKVSCPDIIHSGGTVVFDAAVEPAAHGLTYRWEVSAGAVEGGQGTASMKADATGVAGQSIVATVEVSGLAEGCERKASCETAVVGVVIGCGFDEYGGIAFDDEKARLDNFAIELQNNPTALGHLICYGGRRGRAGEALRRCARAKGYLSKVRGIEPARVVTVDGGFREELNVKLTIVPRGAQPPAPSPTVEPGEVVIIKRAAGRGPRRRR